MLVHLRGPLTVAVVAGALLLFTGAGGHADVQSFSTTGDATAVSWWTWNAGTLQWLDACRIGNDDNYQEESFLRFDTSAAAGRPVQTVRLWLYNYQVNDWLGTTATIEAYAVSGSWTETGLLWSNRPASSGSALDSNYFVAGNPQGWVYWDVTAAFAASSDLDFMLRAQSPPSGIPSFAARENWEFTTDPYLEVTYADADVPEPCSMLLLGASTVFGLGIWRRRRRA